ncbi:hypothetical protein L7F22_041475 [Adiantum nelumboides]|nr:hypothetical protein [Adiantum nelumboides]
MEELFGDGPELGQDDDEEVQEVQLPTSLEPPSKANKQRRWIPAWKLQHKWAYPVIFEGKLRVKCEWCVYSKQKTPYAINGSSTLQLPPLTEHSKLDEHQIAIFKWANKEKRVCIPLPAYVATLEDKEKICHVMLIMVNSAAGIEFTQAIRDVLWVTLCKEIQASPWYSLMVDDNTDRGKEGHLIVYVSYLKDGGKGENHVTFVKLIKTDDGGAKAKYHALLELIKEMGWCVHKLVSLTIDGCSVMVGHRGGLIARMRVDVPHLLLVHCLAHYENLAASQAVDSFPELTRLDKLCRSVYTWLHASGSAWMI